MTTIALLGVGKLGEALLSGLLRSGTPAASMLAAERHADRADEIAQRYGVATPSPEEATAQADVVLLAVKPQDMRALLTDVAGHLRPGTLVVSMAAGITSCARGGAAARGHGGRARHDQHPRVRRRGDVGHLAGSHATAAHLQRSRTCSARSARSCACRSRSRTR
jgi:pyrroline-5-carboxylate reductase